jgi:hypothetical protein
VSAYKFAWYGWLGLTIVAFAVQRPLYAIFPTFYMPVLGVILYKKFGKLSYAEIQVADPVFGRKLSIANLIFVVLNGVILGQIDGKYYA